MYIVGELRDPKMVEEIISGLKDINIEASSEYNSAQDIYILYVIDESSLLKAQDFFRVKMGFKKPVEIDQEWVKIKKIQRGQYTYAMLSISVVIYILSFSNLGDPLYRILFFGNFDSPPFYEIIHGQVWRLITPIFLHMSFLHILFNMLWFKDLGYLIEHSFGKNFLLFFVLITGLISNICQYAVGGPQFGGMSGVLYAMLGFIWVYKKLNSDYEYSLPRFDINMMIGWYFLCLTGVLGPIANTAHGAGLVAGIFTAVGLNFKLEKERVKFFLIGLFFLIFTLVVEGYKLNGRYYILLWK